MNTYSILLKAAYNNPSNRIWGLTQRCYGAHRITFTQLGHIQKTLRFAQPDFFIPNKK